jgi:hypothetical protein
MDIEAFFLFLCKLLFGSIKVVMYCWIVVIPIPCQIIHGRADEVTFQWNTFGKHVCCLWDSQLGGFQRRVLNLSLSESGECVIPVVGTIGIFASHPVQKITVIEVKAKQGTGN